VIWSPKSAKLVALVVTEFVASVSLVPRSATCAEPSVGVCDGREALALGTPIERHRTGLDTSQAAVKLKKNKQPQPVSGDGLRVGPFYWQGGYGG